jgi:hypothetical protein
VKDETEKIGEGENRGEKTGLDGTTDETVDDGVGPSEACPRTREDEREDTYIRSR